MTSPFFCDVSMQLRNIACSFIRFFRSFFINFIFVLYYWYIRWDWNFGTFCKYLFWYNKSYYSLSMVIRRKLTFHVKNFRVLYQDKNQFWEYFKDSMNWIVCQVRMFCIFMKKVSDQSCEWMHIIMK